MTLPSLAKFGAWWASELLAMLPLRLRERLERRPARVVLDFDGQTPDIPGATIANAGGAIAIRLAPSLALRRTLTMPLATEKNLRAVLGFEMDRYTPFKADQVYYDFAVLSRDAGQRRLQVVLVVVPRKDVDGLMERLRQRGVEPASLQVESFDLLPAAQRGARAAGAWLARILAAIAVLLLAAALGMPFVQKHDTAARLENELGEARKGALLAQRAREELLRLAAEDDALVRRRDQRPDALQALHELTRLVPDGSWLNQLEFTGTRVKLRGESPNASELVTALENSPLFEGATFDGSVTRDAKTEREHFTISAAARGAPKR